MSSRGMYARNAMLAGAVKELRAGSLFGTDGKKCPALALHHTKIEAPQPSPVTTQPTTQRVEPSTISRHQYLVLLHIPKVGRWVLAVEADAAKDFFEVQQRRNDRHNVYNPCSRRLS
eukprot:2919496-Amphidinium_carterae.1